VTNWQKETEIRMKTMSFLQALTEAIAKP